VVLQLTSAVSCIRSQGRWRWCGGHGCGLLPAALDGHALAHGPDQNWSSGGNRPL